MSVPGATLGWLIFTPAGFAFDPLFDSIGTLLLADTSALRGVWILLYNTPVIALGNPTNTIVVGSLVAWIVSAIPIFFVMRWAVARYRSTIYERYKDAKIFRPVNTFPGLVHTARHTTKVSCTRSRWRQPVREAGAQGMVGNWGEVVTR